MESLTSAGKDFTIRYKKIAYFYNRISSLLAKIS